MLRESKNKGIVIPLFPWKKAINSNCNVWEYNHYSYVFLLSTYIGSYHATSGQH